MTIIVFLVYRRLNYQVQHHCAKIGRIFVLGRKSSKVFLGGGSIRFAHGGCNRQRQRRKWCRRVYIDG